MNSAEFLIIFSRKQLMGLKFRINYKIDNTSDPLKEALRYFENHPSMTNIKSKSFDPNFTFRDTSSSEVIKLIKTLNLKRLLKRVIFLLRLLNYMLTFSDCSYIATLITVLKKVSFHVFLNMLVLYHHIRRK